ncbi:T9SS type A sorting domain-containing protein [Crocinitomicaceae bacterium]|nr:T9SS type A sorting domain-containing protein [Crocinitomicaceae bacterium]MDC1361753.1 T9SS type A sorting domain-containing protein [Crocinitomicaceae bacterium]
MKNSLLIFVFIAIWSLGFTQTWNKVIVPTSENLNDIEFPDGTTGVGYIGGDNGVLLKTVDGGQSWMNIDYAGIASSEFNPLRFLDLEFVSDEVGFTTFGHDVGWSLYKTIDGGLNWTEIIESAEIELSGFCYKNTIEVMDENHFFIGGRGCFMGPMIVEFNNGEWSLKDVETELFNSGEYVQDIKMHGDLGIASTSSSEFLRTTDGGQSWSSITSPILSPEDNLTDVIIINDTIMYGGLNNLGPSIYSFFESTDSGATWSQVLIEGDLIMYASWFTFEQTNNGVVHASATNDINDHYMHSSIDGVWSYELIDEKVLAVGSYGLNNAFGVGENGFVCFNGSNAGIIEQSIEAKVYPNPALDFITIEIDSQNETDVRVYDLLGALVHQAPVKSNMTIDISQWKSGIYTLKLENTAHVLIKKFVKT